MEEVNSTVKMVSEIGEEFPIVGKLFSIFNKIYEIADQAKQNIKNCKKAATRCKTYEKIICECIVAYKENGVDLSDRKHNKGVRDLKGSVEELKDLLEKYSKGSTFFGRFKKAKSFKDEFEEIDAEIKKIVAEGLSIYDVAAEQLKALKPDIIVTQSQCDVSAISEAQLQVAVAGWIDHHTKIISLAPNGLDDIWADIQKVADAIGVSNRGAT